MKKTLALLLCLAALVGCSSHRELMPFLGKWKGGFVVSDIVGGGSESDKKREQLQGFIQVYETGRTYKMELEGEQETIDIDGTWTIQGPRITLTAKAIVIDDQGGAQQRDPNKKFIPSDAVREAYGRPLIFQISSNKKRLTGLKMTVGKLVGAHGYVKDSF